MDPLRNALLAGLGVASYTQDKLKDLVTTLIDKGDLTREQGENVISEWVAKGEEEKDNVSSRVNQEIQKVLQKLQLVTREDFDALADRVSKLEGAEGE